MAKAKEKKTTKATKAMKVPKTRFTAPVSPPVPEPPPAEPKPVMLRLVSMSPRVREFILPHEVYCKLASECFCEKKPALRWKKTHPKDHKEVLIKSEIRICKSVRLAARPAESEPLHEAVKECPDVKAALRRKWIRLIVV